jgi:hypothetical protein
MFNREKYSSCSTDFENIKIGDVVQTAMAGTYLVLTKSGTLRITEYLYPYRSIENLFNHVTYVNHVKETQNGNIMIELITAIKSSQMKECDYFAVSYLCYNKRYKAFRGYKADVLIHKDPKILYKYFMSLAEGKNGKSYIYYSLNEI